MSACLVCSGTGIIDDLPCVSCRGDYRQYKCTVCETLTIVTDGQRRCKCKDIMAHGNWVEFFD